MINLNSNNYSLLSSGVSESMVQWLRIYQTNKVQSFGTDQTVKAEIEKSRYQIANLLNVSRDFVFFSHYTKQSGFELIEALILSLNIRQIISSKHEHEPKLSFLTMLEKAGRIRLKFVTISESGETDLNQLKEMVKDTKQTTLISLSHANRFTGALLPVKEIVSVCKNENLFFHLDTNLTNGRYRIDYTRLKPDFISFGCNLLNGPEGIGCLLMNRDVRLNEVDFNAVYSYLECTQSQDLALIKGFELALYSANEKLEIYRRTINRLKKHLFLRLSEMEELKPVYSVTGKEGLVNLVQIAINNEHVRPFLSEKFDLRGISIEGVAYRNESTEGVMILSIALNASNTMQEIDLFIDTLFNLIEK